MIPGGRNLENRDYGGAPAEINGERVKERVIGRGWDVISVAVKRYITEPFGEVDSYGSPGVDA